VNEPPADNPFTTHSLCKKNLAGARFFNLRCYSASSADLSMFSVFSSHKALIIPKEQANKTPNIHEKYHIVDAP